MYLTPTLRSQAHWLVAQKANTRPKPAKELTNPNARADTKIKHENTTSCIVHLADSANIKGVTSNKFCNGSTGSCFESPNDTIHVTVGRNAKKRKCNE